MSRVLLCLMLFYLGLHAADKPKWAHQYHFELKKDEWAKVYVASTENTDDEENAERDVFMFRWTLYDGRKVTVLSNYRKFPKQHTLYKKRGLDAHKELILSDTTDRINGKVELLLVFTDFDQSKKHASFDIFIQDLKNRVAVEFDDPRRKREK